MVRLRELINAGLIERQLIHRNPRPGTVLVARESDTEYMQPIRPT